MEWQEGDSMCISVVFSWRLQKAYQRAIFWRKLGYQVKVGGPAVSLQPAMFSGIASVEGECDALWRHNPMATFTSRGCIRRCGFCVVPELEGDIQELTDWEPKPIVCDNNLLACSRRHFDRVVDRVRPLVGIDFNQGLDARLLTWHHADRIAELKLTRVRLAWDHVNLEGSFMWAFKLLRKAGIPKSKIHAYVLIGYEDSPDDALYRLESVRALGIKPNPMRYQPIRAERKNEYVAPGWSEEELRRYMKYWSRLRWYASIPFEEFRPPVGASISAILGDLWGDDVE